MKMIHIGRKIPKGFKELAGAVHLGKGIWILPMEKDLEVHPNPKRGKK